MRLPLAVATAALAAAFAFSASAGAQGGGGQPVELGLAQVVDSARLTDEIRQLPGLPASGASAYAVIYDSTGVLDDVLKLGRDSRADSAVVAVLRRLVAPRLASRDYKWLNVRVQWGAAPTVASFTPRRERRPEIQNRSTIARALENVGSRFAYALRPQGESIVLRILVDEEGAPIDVVASRLTGLPELDRAVMEVAHRVRFRPAMIDDYPMRVWTELPINVRPAPLQESQPSHP
jgi:TonB family protein